MSARRLATGSFALLAVAVLTTSCAAGRYTYVSSTSNKTFFKIPHSWKLYEKAAVLKDPGPLTGVTSADDKFLVRFDGSPTPSIKHSFLDGRFPVGMARVRSLSLDEHDQYSLASLRNEVIPLDSLLQQDAKSVDLLEDPKLLTHDGLRGSQLEYTVHYGTDKSFSAMQVGFVDTPTKKVWFLLVGCSTKCYQLHKATIHRIVESWTVQGK